MKELTIYQIVKKLNGHIGAIGETGYDDDSYENMKQLTELMDSFLFDIYHVSRDFGRQEYSMNRNGEYARNWLIGVRDMINEQLKIGS